MSKTFKHKTRHIFELAEEGKRKLSSKLKWSYFNKCNRHNFDWDLYRKEKSQLKDKISRDNMKKQMEEN